MCLRAVGFVLLLLTGSALAQGPIRLKSGRDPRPAQGSRKVAGPPGASHFMLQFQSYPGLQLREELARRGIRVLGYVPDSALMVSASGSPDLNGLGVAWSGSLSAEDKVSPLVSSAPAPGYVVFFYSDIDRARARRIVASLGFDVIENTGVLKGQLVVTGSYPRLQELAERDEVSYILPASADLVAGNPVLGCAGAVTEAGPVGEYVLASGGWAKDSSGGVALKYFLQSLTNKLDESSVRGELERAFREWQRYANISFTPGEKADAARTITILFARGAHGDSYPFDGAGSVLAHTFYPAPPNAEPLAGDLHLDADENWKVGANIDLFSVALHEAGHALGLGHSDRPGSVMYPYYRLVTGLTDDDIAGVRALYGTGTPATPPPAPGPPTPTQPPSVPSPPTTDSTPPSLRISSPSGTIVSTSAASLRISGTSTDNVAVSAVKWSTSSGESGTASGTTSWSAVVPLLVGNNAVTIRAYDAAGNSSWRAVTIVRH